MPAFQKIAKERLWSSKKLPKERFTELVQLLCSSALGIISRFSERSIASFFEVLVTLWKGSLELVRSYTFESLIEALTKEGKKKIGDFAARNISTCLWSLASLKMLLEEAKGKVGGFNPQDISNCLWSLATLKVKDNGFEVMLLKEAKGKIGIFNPQDISNCLWTLATLNVKDNDFVVMLL